MKDLKDRAVDAGLITESGEWTQELRDQVFGLGAQPDPEIHEARMMMAILTAGILAGLGAAPSSPGLPESPRDVVDSAVVFYEEIIRR